MKAEEVQISPTAAAAMVAEEETADWSDVPGDILYVIMDKMNCTSCYIVFDYIRLGCVCVSWNSVFYHHIPQPLPPLLMVPPPPSINNKKTTLRAFYNISDNKVNDQFQISIPPYRHCRGSSHGWLITVDEISYSVRLFNPFLSRSSSSSSSSCSFGNCGMEIILPSLMEIPIKTLTGGIHNYCDLHKAVLSANPLSNPSDFTVMAIYGTTSRKLVFFKPGGDKANNWSRVKLPKINGDEQTGNFVDVIYYQGKFLAINGNGVVVVCDIDHEDVDYPIARILIEPRESYFKYNIQVPKYLVESSDGNLLMVHRYMNLGRPDPESIVYLTFGFKVFKLLLLHDDDHADAEEGGLFGLSKHSYEWVEVKTLCGDAMFLGQNASLCISSDVYPGCKPNHIYYTDETDYCVDEQECSPHDMGVFNLEDSSFKRHFLIDPSIESDGSIVPIWPVPIWIQPSVPKRIVPTLPVPIWIQPRVQRKQQ